MNLFTRISDIITANVNALLDKAENPEALIAQVVREMESGLERARRYGATAIAAERRLARELERHREQAVSWKEKARRALASGREDLARQALLHKVENEELVRALLTQHARAQETSATVRSALTALEARLAEARRKQRSLIARHRAVRARDQVRRLMEREWPDTGGSRARFGNLESRIEDLEDEMDARVELDNAEDPLVNEILTRERAENVATELETLKKETQ